MGRHVVMDRPWHYLEKIAIEGLRGKAVRGDGCGTGWMEMIQVDTSPHNLNKLLERMPAFSHSSFIRCQVAGDNVRRVWY